MTAVTKVVARRLTHPGPADPIRSQQWLATGCAAVIGLAAACLAAGRPRVGLAVLAAGAVLSVVLHRRLARAMGRLEGIRHEERRLFSSLGDPRQAPRFYWAQRAVASIPALLPAILVVAVAGILAGSPARGSSYAAFVGWGVVGAVGGLSAVELLSFGAVAVRSRVGAERRGARDER